ncbi:MAG: LysR family transcriptional regulator [Myxococcales bacterium]|nr:LysR family transcriptional regulator [Myxococcales bacterium]
MELTQLETFVAVARHGSITRAAEVVHLSQPAVSAQIKTLEERLGLALFERTSRGMRLTADGERLLPQAEHTLGAHRALLDQAAHLRQRPSGPVRLGVDANTPTAALGPWLSRLADRHPEVEVSVQQAISRDVVQGILAGELDAGVFNAHGEPDARLATTEVTRFGLVLVAPTHLETERPPRWEALAQLPWICPDADTCCGRAIAELLLQHGIRPARVIRVDREHVTRSLVASGVGVGLLHSYTAADAVAAGEVRVLCEVPHSVGVLLGHLASRSGDPLLQATVGAFDVAEG